VIIGNPRILWLLILLIGLIAAEYRLWKDKLRILSGLFPGDLENIMLGQWDRKKHLIRLALFWAAIFLLIIAMAAPEWGKKEQASNLSGIDAMIAVDVSKSMLAEDLLPNRLSNAKTSLNLLMDQLAGNRVGLVGFAGSSFINCPLTTDIGAAKMFLDSINTDLIPNGGTDIGGAIEKCVQAFGRSVNSKVIILLTDGEDLGGSALSAADLAAKEGIRIFAIGIGSPAGALVPVYDENGKRSGFKKDEKGEPVLSRVDTGLLREIAQKTGGQAFLVSENSSGFQNLFAAISALPKHKLSGRLAYQYEERFQIFLFLCITCLAAEMLISERKNV